ncbi:MAG: SDR family oxidoreductase [Planctomycetes bacterium]|nr:SDR family oxidoreductase [Planctomycetota bacterium]
MPESMKNKTVLVTGAGGGIGAVTATTLAARGAHVIVHGRSLERVASTLDEIKKAGGSAEGLAMDLASMQSIRDGAAKVRENHDKLDVLINNAGTWPKRRIETVDGLEQMWAVNVLAPILLSHELLEPLKAASKGRVLNVASAYHYLGKINWTDLQFEKRYRYRPVYAQSKLALVMLTFEFARRFAESGVTFNCLHPGTIASQLFRDWPKIIRWSIDLVMRSTKDGAAPQIMLATGHEFEEVSGVYFQRFKRKAAKKPARNNDLCSKLWDIVATQLKFEST